MIKIQNMSLQCQGSLWRVVNTSPVIIHSWLRTELAICSRHLNVPCVSLSSHGWWRAISHRNRCVCMFYIMRGNNLAVCRGITPCCPERQWQTVRCRSLGTVQRVLVYKRGHLISVLQSGKVACCPIQFCLHKCNYFCSICMRTSDFIWKCERVSNSPCIDSPHSNLFMPRF